jgi:hypothetical protein
MEFYDVIQAFQGEKMTNALGHMKNIHVEGNVVYTAPTIRLNTKNYVAPQTSLMQELLGNEYVCMKIMEVKLQLQMYNGII